MSLVRPFVLMFVEPIVMFWNIYITLVYGVLYIFIESFNVVFIEHHGFNLGENGLAYLVSLIALLVSAWYAESGTEFVITRAYQSAPSSPTFALCHMRCASRSPISSTAVRLIPSPFSHHTGH